MPQFGGKPKKSSSVTKRHFTVVIDKGGKEHGLYVSSTPSSAARKAVTKLCASNKGKKVEFHIREITQGSKKKTYGPYEGYIEKLKESIELKGRIIKYKPVAKLSEKKVKKGGGGNGNEAKNSEFSNKNKHIKEAQQFKPDPFNRQYDRSTGPYGRPHPPPNALEGPNYQPPLRPLPTYNSIYNNPEFWGDGPIPKEVSKLLRSEQQSRRDKLKEEQPLRFAPAVNLTGWADLPPETTNSNNGGLYN